MGKVMGTVAAAPAWDALRAHLEAARERIFAAIRSYPSPITACDAQFNHLLEERARIAGELARLEAARAADDASAALEAFLDTCPYLDDAARRRIVQAAPGGSGAPHAERPGSRPAMRS
jgi:hypothetical protein